VEHLGVTEELRQQFCAPIGVAELRSQVQTALGVEQIDGAPGHPGSAQTGREQLIQGDVGHHGILEGLGKLGEDRTLCLQPRHVLGEVDVAAGLALELVHHALGVRGRQIVRCGDLPRMGLALAGQQHLDHVVQIRRVGDEGVGADRPGQLLIRLLGVRRGDEYHGDAHQRRVLPDGLTELEAVKVGHQDVADYCFGRGGTHLLEGLQAVLGGGDAEASLLLLQRQQLALEGVVVDDQDPLLATGLRGV
jgi:hypothetical protein